MRTYRPSHRLPTRGWVLLSVWTLVGALLIGGFAFAVSQLIYLIVLFPLLMGLLGGVLLAMVVRQGKVRHPLVVGIFAVLLGVLTIGALRFGEYQQFRYRVAHALMRDEMFSGSPSIRLSLGLVDALVTERTHLPGFLGYLKYTAALGTEIKHHSSSLKLNEAWTWVLQGVEVSLCCAIIALIAVGAANKPFCERCDTWYQSAQLLCHAPPESAATLVQHIRALELSQAAALLQRPDPAVYPRVEIHTEHCASCPLVDYVMTVKRVAKNRKGETDTRILLTGMLSAEELATLTKGLTAGEPAPPETANT